MLRRHRLPTVAAWLVFGTAWLRVADNGSAPTTVTFAFPIAVALAVGVLTWAWIGHNVGIARRRPRRGTPVGSVPCATDRLGRRIVFEPTDLPQAVVVTVQDDIKRYASAP